MHDGAIAGRTWLATTHLSSENGTLARTLTYGISPLAGT